VIGNLGGPSNPALQSDQHNPRRPRL